MQSSFQGLSNQGWDPEAAPDILVYAIDVFGLLPNLCGVESFTFRAITPLPLSQLDTIADFSNTSPTWKSMSTALFVV